MALTYAGLDGFLASGSLYLCFRRLCRHKELFIPTRPVLKHVLWLGQLALERELLLNEGPLPLASAFRLIDRHFLFRYLWYLLACFR